MTDSSSFGNRAVESIIQNAVDNIDLLIFDTEATDEATDYSRTIAKRLWVVKEILRSAQNVLDLNKGE